MIQSNTSPTPATNGSSFSLLVVVIVAIICPVLIGILGVGSPLLVFAGLLALCFGFALGYLTLNRKVVLVIGGLIVIASLLPNNLAIEILPGIPQLTISRAYLAVILFVWLLRTVVTEQRFPQAPLLPLLIIFVFVNTASTLLGVNPATGIIKLFGYIVEWLAVYILAYDLIRTTQQARTLLKVFVAVAVVVALLGIVEQFTRFNFADLISFGHGSLVYASQERAGGWRVRGPFFHPIGMGVFLALSIQITLALLSSRQTTRKIRRRYWLAFGLQAVALLFTFSFGPWLGLTVSLVGFLWIRSKRLLILSSLASPLLVFPQWFGLPETAFSEIVQSKFVLDFNILYMNHATRIATYGELASMLTLGGRVELILTALATFQQHPLLGSGLNTWFEVTHSTSNDNFFAQVLVETGLLGLGVVLLLFGNMLLQMWQVLRSSMRRATPAGQLLIGPFFCVVSFFVMNVTSAPLVDRQIALLFWFICGTGMRLVRLARRESAQLQTSGKSNGSSGNYYQESAVASPKS